MDFIHDLKEAFEALALPQNARPMEAYMKNRFPFLGIKTTERRTVFRELLKRHKGEISQHARAISQELWALPQREYHYCAVEVFIEATKKGFDKGDISLFEKMIITSSWWDTVDVIAKYLVGGYLKQFTEMREKVIEKFSSSGNMWLNRTAILFQLGYKKETNAALLFRECDKHKGSKEFFIRKAIGWALREYAKTNPEAVKSFVKMAGLSPLSEREALKNL